MESQSVSKARIWIVGIAMATFLVFIIVTVVYLQMPPRQKMKDQVKIQLPSSGTHEECLKLLQENEVVYSFEASHPLTFDIHYHDGTQIVDAFAKKTIAALEATLQPEIAQEYCITWSNHQPQAVQLNYQFQINVK
jgi:hypothetical protein|tara:strand:+ start:3897 stop:4304 length:408 start_codon:yes stop_codon:yes gene_type:complete